MTEDSDGLPAPGPTDPVPTWPEFEALRDAVEQYIEHDRSLGYHAVVRAFTDGYAGVLNWRLEGAAAAIGADRVGKARESGFQRSENAGIRQFVCTKP